MPFGNASNMRFDCRLVRSSSVTLTLNQCVGASLFIDGENYSLFNSGGAAPQIDTTGLSADTDYFVYAYWDGAEVQLELSSSVAPTDFGSLYGHLIKGTDKSRTYVGRIRTTSSTTFADSDTQRFCASYFNRINKSVQRTVLTGNPTTTSATFVELTSGDKAEFIAFGEEWSNCYYSGCALNATEANIVGASLGVNGTAIALAPNLFNQPTAADYAMPISGNIGYKFDPGYNYINLLGKSSGGTLVTFAGANCGFGAMLRQ